MSFILWLKKMIYKKQISVILLATLPDSGIKSLGSKSLLWFKDKYLIEYQLDTIRSALKNISHDITIMCGFDAHRVSKALVSYCEKFNINLIKQTCDPHLNFVGSFLYGLDYVSYENVLSINYGTIFKKNTITELLDNMSQNKVGVTKNNSLNENIKIGCLLNNENIINIFYNLGQHKYLDINYWTADTIKYIKQYISINDHKNKFMFELINLLHENNFEFKYSEFEPKNCVFIDSLKMLTKSKRIFINENATNKKTKY